MCRNGFSLLECQLYLFLTILSLLLVGTFILNFLPSLKKLPLKLNEKIQLIVAYQQIMHDVSEAPYDNNAWKKKTAQEVIWTVQGIDYGWALRKKKLVKNKGIFSTAQQKWHEKISSVALDHVITFSLSYTSASKNIRGINCLLATQQQEISLPIRLAGITLCNLS